jgi:hypothetical protein
VQHVVSVLLRQNAVAEIGFDEGQGILVNLVSDPRNLTD